MAVQDEDIATFEFLWLEYGLANDEQLTEDAKKLKQKLREIIGIDKLEAKELSEWKPDNEITKVRCVCGHPPYCRCHNQRDKGNVRTVPGCGNGRHPFWDADFKRILEEKENRIKEFEKAIKERDNHHPCLNASCEEFKNTKSPMESIANALRASNGRRTKKVKR